MMERGIARCTNHSFVWLECYSTCFKQLKPQWELRLIGSGKILEEGGGERGGQRREGVKRVHGCYVPIAACHHLHVLGEEDHRYQTLSST